MIGATLRIALRAEISVRRLSKSFMIDATSIQRGPLLSTMVRRSSALAALLIAANVAPALAKIHPGDRVAVLVYNHPELSGQATVDGAGKISLPLAGGVDTTDLEPSQVAQRVQHQLSPYVRRVAVDVQLVAQAQSIFVAGGPGGILAYSPGENLAGALSQLRQQLVAVNNLNQPTAQVSPDFGNGRIDLEHVAVVRDGSVIGQFNANDSSLGTGGAFVLQAGDTLQLRDKPIPVTVRGEVKEPGVAYLNQADPLSSAITQVGGELPTSATSNVTLERAGVNHVVAFGSAEFSQPAQPGDVIIVSRAPVVSVLGMVVKPGDVQLKTDSSLLGALYGADGIQKWADLKKVQVLHHGQKAQYDVTALVHGDVTQNPQLADGDTVFIPEGHKVDWQTVFSGLGLLTGYATRYIPQRVTP